MPKLSERVRVEQMADSLWEEIGPFDAVGDWHPLLNSIETTGSGPGAERRARDRDGQEQVERLLEVFGDGRGYRYEIVSTALPVRDYVAAFAVADNGDETSTISWSAEFTVTSSAAGNTVAGIRDVLRAGLEALAGRYGRASVPRLVGINHIALEVGDLDAALAFYRRLFDFALRGRVPGMAFIDMGDQFLALSEGRSQPPDEHRHFGLVVDDRSGLRERALSAGAEILDGPGLEIRDPWGNRLEVVEYPRLQFTKSEAVMRAMNIASEKTDDAVEELRGKGIDA